LKKHGPLFVTADDSEETRVSRTVRIFIECLIVFVAAVAADEAVVS
jgi:hypothetical protein